jgi:hypothetical protein
MRKPSSRSTEQTSWKKGSDSTTTTATETDRLLPATTPSFFSAGRSDTIRSRKSSQSPTLAFRPGQPQQQGQMNRAAGVDPSENDVAAPGYNAIKDEEGSRDNASVGESSRHSASSTGSHTNASLVSLRRKARVEKLLKAQNASNTSIHPPLLEIPEEIYAVRKAALQVLKPLTKTWVSR